MKAALQRLLAMEPVAVQGVVRLAFVLLATVGVTVSDEITGQVLAAIAAAYALLEAVTTLWARSKSRAAATSTPNSSVVAVIEPDGTTVAGPASPLPDGTPVTPGLTDHDTLHLARVHDDLPPDDPGRPVIESVLDQARHLA